ncbi:MAG: CYTH domain-containing protein [Clostridia bacterium]|nr:CYTH domain-containing protein [Clostridia bacterium]
MDTNQEYELKLMLLENEYNILAELGGEEPFLQVNHYYDTVGLDLYKSRRMLRIRNKNGGFELTVKTAGLFAGREGIASMTENNIILDAMEAAMILGGRFRINEYLTAFPDIAGFELLPVGTLATLRKKVHIAAGLPMAEVDKNSYLGIVDYELEWEIDEGMYGHALDVLKEKGIGMECRETGRSKYGRFIARLPGKGN